jgi:hypothetical protein
MLKSIITVVAMAGLLSGCGISASNYSAGREVLRGSPQLRAQSMETCVRNQQRKPLATRQSLAKLMNVSVSAAPRTVCRRIQSGITSGRLKHSDVDSGMRGRMTPNLIRVLQGR